MHAHSAGKYSQPHVPYTAPCSTRYRVLTQAPCSTMLLMVVLVATATCDTCMYMYTYIYIYAMYM